MHCASPHRLSGFRKARGWGPGKKRWLQKEGSLNRSGLRKWKGAQKAEDEILVGGKILKVGKILEIRELCGDEAVACPGTLASNARDACCRKQHSRNQDDFSVQPSQTSSNLPAEEASVDLGT